MAAASFQMALTHNLLDVYQELEEKRGRRRKVLFRLYKKKKYAVVY
jgi:hypothetical protein